MGAWRVAVVDGALPHSQRIYEPQEDTFSLAPKFKVWDKNLAHRLPSLSKNILSPPQPLGANRKIMSTLSHRVLVMTTTILL